MKRQDSGQLLFVFADNSKECKKDADSDVSDGKSFLQQIAKARTAKDSRATVRPSSLMEEIASPQNLASALLQVARNHGAPGADGITTKEILQAAPRLLESLRADLLSGRYRPGDIRRVEIPKPGGGTRALGIPDVRDRWVQQAAQQVLATLFEPEFHNSSHGFRPNRGATTAVAEAKEHLNGGCNWVVGIDLSKFFDRVNHQRLLAKLARTISDKSVLKMIHLMLKARIVLPNGTRVNTEEGVPQGGPLSPLLSNIVLDELDWEMHRRNLKFVRYADDFNVYVASERAGHRVMATLTSFIERRLRLKVNLEKSEVSPPGQVHLLGFSLTKGKEGAIEVRPSKRTQERMRVRIRELTPRNWGGTLETCFEQANTYLKGWSGYFKLCTYECKRTLNTFDAHLRRRIRAIIVKQKKKPKFLFKHLIQRGVKAKAAAQAALRACGIWNKSNAPGLTQAYRNHWFTGRLTNLWEEWQRLNPPTPVVNIQLLLEF